MEIKAINNFNQPTQFRTKAKQLRAVIYCRVSSEEQARKEMSIPKDQIPLCTKYIQESGWRYVKTYSDPGIDGGTFIKRPELQAMLAAVDTYDVVVLYNLDRLGRTSSSLEKIYDVLDRSGKQITSFVQKLPIVDPEFYDPKSLSVQMNRKVNEIGTVTDSGSRRQRFMDARLRTVEAGKHITQPPYGYKMRRELNPFDNKLTIGYRVINENESPIVKRIFDERAIGRSYMEIACGLNKDGLKARQGGEWEKARIGQVLRNSFSAGFIVWNKTTDRKFGDSSKITPILQEKWRYIPVNMSTEIHYQAIITRELFEKAQEITRNNRGLRGKASYSRNVLAGLVKCPVCGKPMVETSFEKLKKYPFYNSYLVCTQWNAKKRCVNKRYRSTDIKEYVTSEIIRYFNNPREFERHHYQNRDELLREKNKEFYSYDSKVKKAQGRIYELNVKYLDKKIKEEYYREMLNTFEVEEAGLKKKMADLRTEIDDMTARQQKVVEFRTLGETLKNKFNGLDMQQKKTIFQFLIERIRLEEGKIRIIFKV